MIAVVDIECFTDYFLICFKEVGTDKTVSFELFPGAELDVCRVKKIMKQNTTVSFNGLSYDLPLIQAVIEGYSNEKLKSFSDKIIKSKLPSYKICRQNNINVPAWDHIDLIEIAPGQASLKIYGGRMHCRKMQDLPFDPSELITPGLRDIIKTYCLNDLSVTEQLYNTLKPQITLRESMSKQYDIDLRSKSDAQIAEAVIKSELQKITGKTYSKPEVEEGTKFRYQNPGIISFSDNDLQELFENILIQEFELSGSGSIKMPDWLKNTKIKIGDGEYQIGIGGLHSCETAQMIKADGDTILCDYDVASYYPSIILQQQLAPKVMAQDFLDLYQSLVTRRLNAKKAGDKVTADTLKICLNGSFGKLGSKYSALYAPELLIQTTITGQLALLMLIERMEATGIKIMSANTDGIVCHAPKTLERNMEAVAWDWMLDTSFDLERTDYKLLAARDVNSYIAIKPDGTVKRKGCFAGNSLSKNPDRSIVYTAVVEFLKEGTPIEDTITGCTDPRQFVKVRAVKGGAVFKGEKIGKAVRYYSVKAEMFQDDCIYYALNGNKVAGSSGCRPLMELPEQLPDDLNFNSYISEANELLKEVGYHA